MKLVFVLSTMAISMVADATMVKKTSYAGSACGGDPTEIEWSPADTCYEEEGNSNFMQLTCSGNNAMITGYEDNSCNTVNRDLTIPGLTITDGVLNAGSSCHHTTGEAESSKWSCANQPKQVKMLFFSDAACNSATPTTYAGATSLKLAIDVCEFDKKDDGQIKAKKRTESNGVMTEKEYSTIDCTGDSTGTPSVVTLADCVQISETPPVYWTQHSSGVITADAAQAINAPATNSGTDSGTSTAAPAAAAAASASGASLPYNIIASVLSVVASAAASI